MTPLYIITLLAVLLNISIRIFNKLNPPQSGDDYTGEVGLAINTAVTIVCVSLSFIALIV